MENEDLLHHILQPLVTLAHCLKMLSSTECTLPLCQSCPHDIGGPTVCVTAIDEIRELIQLQRKQSQKKFLF